MIAYLEGKLTHKTPTQVHLDIGGIAYELNISLNTYAEIENQEEVRLHTHLVVKEDSHTIYGFSSPKEKEVFKQLISVSGVGPNTARVTLSYMTVNEVQKAVLNENVAAFKKVKGVGPKTAKMIILELKNKIAKIELEEGPNQLEFNSDIREEAIAALMALGFHKSSIDKHIDHILASNPQINQVEVLIKAVLRQMS